MLVLNVYVVFEKVSVLINALTNVLVLKVRLLVARSVDRPVVVFDSRLFNIPVWCVSIGAFSI